MSLARTTSLGLTDLFASEQLEAEVAAGYVSRREHPSGRLAILNYTDKAAWEGRWNQVTSACRGLIYSTDTDLVVARPFAKFFNWGQSGAATVAGPVEVTDKLDGSMGVLYHLDGEPAIATRGSFTSDQALHATDVYRTRYHGRWTPWRDVTYLYEIVYPENRIVVDYGALDDLVLLAGIEIRTGRSLPVRRESHSHSWPGPVAAVMRCATLEEALALPPRPNAEGLVVHAPATGARVKIKQEDYVRLHRLLTGVSTIDIWRAVGLEELAELGLPVKRAAWALRCPLPEAEAAYCAGPQPLDRLLRDVPDEFYSWVRRTIDETLRAVADLRDSWYVMYRDLGLADLASRAEVAARVRQRVPREHHGALFTIHDGHDPVDQAWRVVRPAYGRPFMQTSEDVA